MSCEGFAGGSGWMGVATPPRTPPSTPPVTPPTTPAFGPGTGGGGGGTGGTGGVAGVDGRAGGGGGGGGGGGAMANSSSARLNDCPEALAASAGLRRASSAFDTHSSAGTDILWDS